MQPLKVVALVTGKVSREEWARAHQAHLTAGDIEYLRQLVEGAAAEDAADPRHARVAANFEEPWIARLIEMLQSRLLQVGTLDHGPKLEHLEWFAAQAGARLSKQDWSLRVKFDH